MTSIAIALTLLLYARGWLRLLSSSSTAIPLTHAGAFVLGLALVELALVSPIASCDAGSLTGHMVQHLLLMTFAPPLILWGEPLLVLSRGLPRSVARSVVDPLSRRPALRGLGRMLVQPSFCWLAATLTLVVWHVPAVFALALSSHAWHAVEQASFLATGILFWWPVLEPWPSAATGPRWTTVLYLFLATLPCDVLSGFLVFSERVAYSEYLSHEAHRGLPALADQQRAGALMWTAVTLVYFAAGAVLSTRLLAAGHPAPKLVQHVEVD